MMNKVLIGFLFILFILYNRLWRVRIPRNFTDMTNSPYHLLYIVIIIGFLIALMITIYQIYVTTLKIKEKYNFITKKLKVIMEHAYNPFYIISTGMIALDAFLKNNTPSYNDNYSFSDIIIKKSAYFLLGTKIKAILTIIFLRLIPQIIVCISFLVDILLHDNFIYFYKSLILLIIPLIVYYIQYSIENFINCNLEGLNDVLVIRSIPLHLYTKNIPLNSYNIISIYEKRDLLLSAEGVNYIFNNNLSKNALESFNNNLEDAQASLETAVDMMNDLFSLNRQLLTFKEYKFILEAPFKILKYILYIIGWLYILKYL